MFHKLLQKTVVFLCLPQLALYPALTVAEVPVPSANFSANDGGKTRIDVTGSAGQQAMRLLQPDKFNTYNWDSFNIGAGDSVTFQQPSDRSTALNYIHQNSISKIAGQLKANGNLYLINQNGFLFGDGAMVNVGSLVASVLNIDEEMLADNGLVQSMQQQKPAFFADGVLVDEDGKPYSIEIEKGAQIMTEGGRVLLVAPEIINNGSISTPDGQAILAASKDEVYLAASTDPDLRGLFVEVNEGGDVTNRGEIIAERGNISILGMAINQEGTLRATTSVEVNGSIRLLARDTVSFNREQVTSPSSKDKYLWGSATADNKLELSTQGGSFAYMTPSKTGSVTFGSGSITEVIPDKKTEKKLAPGGQDQRISYIDVIGNKVSVKSEARLTATGGKIQLAALASPNVIKGQEFDANSANENTALVVEDGAIIDVSGSDEAIVEMSRNQLEVKVAGNELRDSPLQKEGILSGEKIYVDIRESEDIAIADISGAVNKIERNIHERLAVGGAVDLFSAGDMQVQKNAVIDVSGGSIRYKPGYIFESKLVSNGELIPVSKASPLRDYQAILNQGERLNETWKVIEKFDNFVVGGEGVFVAAYRQGKDAGSVNIVANPAGVKDAFQFNGSVVADTYIGPYQRAKNSQPDGGELNLNFQLSESGIANIVIANEELIRKSLASQLEPDAGNESPQVFIADNLVAASVDNLSIQSNASLGVDKSANLILDGGGSLKLNSFDTLSVAGSITNYGGSVTLKAAAKNTGNPSPDTRIEMQSGARIDVSGLWVNDVKTPGLTSGITPINLDAGNVALSANGSVLLENDSAIIADGGAHLDSDGGITGGAGGDISLAAGNFDNNPDAVLKIDPDAHLSSLALSDGGTLSLTARGFQLGASALDREMVRADSGRLLLDFDRFKEGGFKNYLLSAKQTGVEISSSEGVPSTLLLETENYLLPPLASADENGVTPLDIKTGTLLADFANKEVLHRGVAKPVGLDIRSTEAEIDHNSTINIGEGVEIQLLAASTLAFSSDDSINLKGSILAPGGDVRFTLNQAGDAQSHDDSQAIRIFNTGLIDVSAIAQGLPEDGSFDKYALFDAGAITLEANRGYILGQDGTQTANLLADGADISLVNPNTYLATGDSHSATENIALDAGDIYLRAAEGIIFDGVIQAKKAVGEGARGGSLQLVLNANPRLVNGDISPGIISSFAGQNTSGSIVIQDIIKTPNRLDDIMGSGSISTAITERDGLDIGRAYVNIADIESGGFDRLTLRAINNIGEENTTKAVADIRFETASTLRLGEALILDAPSILVNDNSVKIETNYLQMGTTTMLPEQIAAYKTSLVNAESGTLSASAGFVDLMGAIEFSDAKLVSIFSENDIRLIGRTEETIPNEGAIILARQRALPSGQLIAYGDVSVSASQIVPTTATRYTIKLPESGAVFRTAASGEQAPVLSAQSVLNIEADVVEHAGVMKAPFGEININASQSIHLLDGSLLSVSGEGQIVPFGQVTDDGVWHYSIAGSTAETTPYLINAQSLKDKAIRLQANAINYASGATVDISGGGDLLGYKWTKGRGGSMDVLGASYPGNSFAVLPAYGNGVSGRYGIYDPHITGGGLPEVGRTVYLDEAAGLAAGEYAVLPARYAMLPGAYLITPAGEAGAISAGQRAKRIDGAEIVAGQFAFAQSNARDSQWSPFVIESGEVAYTRSQYDNFLASQFFDRADNIGRLALNQDAGNLSLIAGASLILEGDLLAATAESGVGARLDISANFIEVVSNKSNAEGVIQLLDSDLNKLEVESILLGANRRATAEGMALDVSANEVVVAEGVKLEQAEILLAAKQRVLVSNGASITSRTGSVGPGGIARTSGDGAFLQVSDGGGWNLVREGFNGQSGDLFIEESASLFGEASVTLESSHVTLLSGQFATNGELNFTAGALQLGSGGGASQNTLVLSDEQLLSLAAPSIRFKARTVMSIGSDLNLSAEQFVLDAPQIIGVGEGVQASFTGEKAFILANSSESSPTPYKGEAVSASLSLHSQNVLLQGSETPNVSIHGFASVFLGENAPSAKQGGQGSRIFSDGDFSLRTDGDLALGADELTVSAGNHLDIKSGGRFALNKASVNASTANAVSGLGGSINIEANDIFINSLIKANSGYIGVSAAQDITLGETGEIDVSGIQRIFGTLDPVTEYTDAGAISLSSKFGDLSSHSLSKLNLSNVSDTSKAGALTLEANSGSAKLQGEILADGFNNQSGEVIAELANLDADSNFLVGLSQHGFNGRLSLHLAEGDVLVSEENRLRSHDINLVAEQGDIKIWGELNASDANGGKINLASAQTIFLGENANLEAKSLSVNGDGGSVVFQNQRTTGTDGINFENGNTGLNQRARIDVSSLGAGKAGQVRFISALSDDKADVKISGEVDVFGAEFIEVSPHLRLEDASITQGDIVAASAGFETLFLAEENLSNRLNSVIYQNGSQNKAGISFRPVIELYSSGSMGVDEDINVSKLRFGSAHNPAELWLRSANDLSINNNVYAGVRLFSPQIFFPNSTKQISPLGDGSWSFSLVSGASISSADYRHQLLKNQNTVLQDGVSIITGTGDISLYSSGDILLNNGASIKSIGRASSLVSGDSEYIGWDDSFSIWAPGLITSAYPDSGSLTYEEVVELFSGGNEFENLRAVFFGVNGGDINLYAKSSIEGNGINQLDTEWRYRANGTFSFNELFGIPESKAAIAWGIDYDNFNTGVGTLGGGDIFVSAGGDVSNLLLAAPTVGKPVEQGARVDQHGGGDISVDAGGSINTSAYLVSDGQLSLNARDHIGISEGSKVATLITYGNAVVEMTAGGDIELSGSISEFLSPVSEDHHKRLQGNQAYWIDQSAENSLSLKSTAGQIYFNTYDQEAGSPIAELLADNLDAESLAPWPFYSLLPQKLSATSFNSDIVIEQSFFVMPGSDSRFKLLAENNIIAGSDRTVTSTLISSLKHLPSSGLPSIADPVRENNTPLFLQETRKQIKEVGRVFETDPGARSFVIANSGDIVSQDAWELDIEKPSYIEAGRDILNPNFNLLHNDSTHVSRVIAGRDIDIPTERDLVDGSLPSNAPGGIFLEGPGVLMVQAGRNINLGASEGIRTLGDTKNTFLADEGADLYVLAGISTQPNFEQFASLYPVINSGEKPRDLQLYDHFLEELKNAGEEAIASTDGASAYDPAYALVDSLFPGSTDKAGPWMGDISLVFSTLQTEDGGNVNIFTPGGGVDVGLTSNLITKSADGLGIFTKTTGSILAFSEDSIEVNLSRIFALNGGDVMLWSSNGDIDAGKGARSTQSLPPPLITVNEDGEINVTFSAAIDGSGIGGFTQPGVEPGDVFLFAPRGVVDAGEAGIRVEGNLQIGGELLNADNVDVGGVSVGVPTDTGVSAGMAGLGSLASSSTDAATENVSGAVDESSQQQAAFLTVEIIGLGD